MAKYSGSITIFDENSDIAYERNLSSDEIIETLLNRSEATPEEKEEEEYIAQKPKKAKKKGARKSGRGLDPDVRDAVVRAIQAGKKAGEIAENEGIEVSQVYTIKAQLKKEGNAPKKSRTQRAAEAPLSDAELNAPYVAPEEKKEEEPTIVGKPLSEEEYNDLKTAMQDKEFQSGRYALTHRLSPREINKAVPSADYQTYIDDLS